jgi:enoyl-[acyl-carrier protein] reductase II
MAWIADARLASAVSNAGGLGIIFAMNLNADYLRGEIKKAKTLTNSPSASISCS